MHLCFVANPRSGRATWQQEVRRRAEALGARWYDTEGPGDGSVLARQAVRSGCTRVVVVGGDGTIREVIDGLGPSPRCGLAIVPAGTGNDLARSLAVPFDPHEATELAFHGATRRIDLIHATRADGTTRLGVNMAVAGLAGTLGQRVSPEAKERFGALAYLGQALADLPELAPYQVRVTLDDGPPDSLEVLGGVVANGRTCAGGYRAAPGANLEDGLLDVFLVRPMPALELAALGARLASGDYRKSPDVLTGAARRVTIEATPPMPFNLDGDPLGETPLRFEAVPGALEVVVGPDYVDAPTATLT